jgi:hypothetical protein
MLSKYTAATVTLACWGLGYISADAGMEIDGKTKVEGKTEAVAPKRSWFPVDPAGLITIGGQFSSGLTGAYLDSITGLWAPQSRDP